MSRASGRGVRRGLLALLVASATAVLLPSAGAAASADGRVSHAARGLAAQPTPGPARLTISSVSPDLVTAGSTVQVTGVVTNTGTAPLEQVFVRLRAVSGRLGTRVAVDEWLSGQDPRTGYPVQPAAILPQPIAPGARAAFTVSAPAATLGLGGDFGAYPLAVDARATPTGAPREQVALVRTTVQWQPAAKQYNAQRIAYVVPFTGLPGPTADARLTTGQVAQAVGPGSRLRRLLDAASVPGVAWAVDPQLLATLQDVVSGTSAGAGGTATATAGPSSNPSTSSATSPSTSSSTGPGSTPSGSPTSPPSDDAAARAVVADYLSAMKAAAVGREVVELPYADPDLQVVSDAGQSQLLLAARAAGAGTITEVLGSAARTDVGWPADGYASDGLVRQLAGQGVHALVLDGRSRPLVEALSYTPDARAALPSGSIGLLADAQLSALMAALRTSDASARSRFLAETAAATTERPGLSRRLLVALPRDVDLQPAAFRSILLAGSSTPWLAQTGLADLLTPLGPRGDTSQLQRRSVPPRLVLARRGVTVPDVQQAVDLRARLSALGEVVADPVRTTAALQRSTLALVSAVWRGHRSELVQRQRRSAVAVDRVTAQVHVLPTTITFLRSSGALKLTIANDLDQQVRDLRLRVVAPNPRLVVLQELSTPIDLAPGTRASVLVPVRALASGQVQLQAQLVAPSGAAIGQPMLVKVRVRPTDSWVLTIGGAVVGLVVVVGLIRALRRPRRRRPV